MKMKFLVIVIVILGLLLLCPIIVSERSTVKMSQKQTEFKENRKKEITEEGLLYYVNIERERVGVEPLRLNKALKNSATLKAIDMMSQQYWNHYAPNGTTPWSFILGSGYKYEFAGENLSKNYRDSYEVVYSWMDSQAHRKNLLNSRFEEIGFGIVKGDLLKDKNTTLVVSHLAKQL